MNQLQGKHPTILCKECGQPMEWRWSQGSWDQGKWVIICRNSGSLGASNGCLLCGRPFSPDEYDGQFAVGRAMTIIRHAQAGIFYRNPEGTIDEWIHEAIERGILPVNWQQWGEVAR